jgi:hypothetical protein
MSQTERRTRIVVLVLAAYFALAAWRSSVDTIFGNRRWPMPPPMPDRLVVLVYELVTPDEYEYDLTSVQNVPPQPGLRMKTTPGGDIFLARLIFSLTSAALLACAAAGPVLRVLKRTRHRDPACPACGYDLRGTPAPGSLDSGGGGKTCPECGAVIPTRGS